MTNALRDRVILYSLILSSIAGLSASAAGAGEVYGGVYKHDMSFVRDLFGDEQKLYESGEDFELGWRSEKMEGWDLLKHPSLYVQTQINDAGNTNQISAGLTWKVKAFNSDNIYIRPGWGLATHDGRLSIPDPNEVGITPQEKARREALALEPVNEYGSRVLWNLQFGVGYDLSDNASIEINWNHMSHAFLMKADESKGETNQGQDNLGIRFNYRY